MLVCPGNVFGLSRKMLYCSGATWVPQDVHEYCREQFVCSREVLERSKSVVEFPEKVFVCPAEVLACSNESAERWRTMRGCCGDMCVSSGEKHWFTGNKLVSAWEVLVDHREVLGVPRKIAGCPWRCLCTLRRC